MIDYSNFFRRSPENNKKRFLLKKLGIDPAENII